VQHVKEGDCVGEPAGSQQLKAAKGWHKAPHLMPDVELVGQAAMRFEFELSPMQEPAITEWHRAAHWQMHLHARAGRWLALPV
jgi:hypothetical protein